MAAQRIPQSYSRWSDNPESALAFAQIKAKAEEEARKRYGTSLRSFTANVRPSFVEYKHNAVLNDVLDQVAEGKLKRLMIFEPPRHGKTEQASRLFPAYYLYRNPTHHFGITSYAADLAYGISRDARDNYVATGRRLRESAEGMIEWHTTQGGRCWSAGVGGPITGKGGHVLLVDDPFKNAEEAYSVAYQNKVFDWWQHVLYTRLEPDGAIILIMTRWHMADLAGKLLDSEKKDELKENWTIVNLEAIKRPVKPDFPTSCTVIPDWRKPGEALCPERYNTKSLAQTRSKVGPAAWGALYQQDPLVEEGNIWKLDWFKNSKYTDEMLVERKVKLEFDGLDWDLAYGDEDNEENAAHAFVRSARGNDGNIYVYDCDFQWYEFPRMVEWMNSIEAPHYIEAKASGKSARQSLSKVGAYATEVQVRGRSGDKIARTQLATPVVSQGRVFIHARIFDKLLLDDRQGILGFPAKPFKDLNDAFVQALNRHWPFTPAVTVERKIPTDPHKYMVEEVMDKIGTKPKSNGNTY